MIDVETRHYTLIDPVPVHSRAKLVQVEDVLLSIVPVHFFNN